MSASIIVLRNQNGWEERRGTCSSQPSSCGVVELSRHAGCISTIFGHVSFTSVRGTVADGKRTRHRTSFSFQSAAPSPLRSVIAAESSPGGGVTAGSLLPAWRGSRLFLNFFGAFKALRSLTSLHRGSALFQSSERGAAPDFHGISSLLPSVEQHDRRMRQGVGNQPQELGKRTQELVKVGQGNE